MDHRLACLHEILQETRARDLRVAEATRCDEVLSTEVLDVGMVRIEAGWRPFQGLALEFDLRSKDGLPSIGLVDDSIPDFLEDPRLRMPDAGMDAALPGLQVEKSSLVSYAPAILPCRARSGSRYGSCTGSCPARTEYPGKSGRWIRRTPGRPRRCGD